MKDLWVMLITQSGISVFLPSKENENYTVVKNWGFEKSRVKMQC